MLLQQQAEVWQVEAEMDGQLNQHGRKQGPYMVGGLSERSVQRMKAEARKQFDKGELDEAGLKAKLRNAQMKRRRESKSAQTTLDQFSKQHTSIEILRDEDSENEPYPKRICLESDSKSKTLGLEESAVLQAQNDDGMDFEDLGTFELGDEVGNEFTDMKGAASAPTAEQVVGSMILGEISFEDTPVLEEFASQSLDDLHFSTSQCLLAAQRARFY